MTDRDHRHLRVMRRAMDLVLPIALLTAGCTQEAPSPTAGAEETTFVAVGHTRLFFPRHLHLYRVLAERINAESPDYVFLLGDLTSRASRREYRELERRFLDRLEAPWYWAAGNHDVGNRGLRRDRRRHVARAGYAYALVQDERANFVVVNSCDDPATMGAELLPLLDTIDRRGRSDRPTLLMTHHRLWLPKDKPRRRVDRDDVFPMIRGRVDAIIAGNVSATFEDARTDGLRVVSVGMGYEPGHEIRYAVGRVGADGRLDLAPVVVDRRW